MREETKDLKGAYLIFILIFLAIMFVPLIDMFNLLPETFKNSKFYTNLCLPPNIYIYRIFYIIAIPISTMLMVSTSNMKSLNQEKKNQYKIYYVIASVPLLIGFINHPVFHIYNVAFMPLLVFSHLYIASKAFTKIAANLNEEDSVIGINKKELGPMGLEFQVLNPDTEKYEALHVHNVFQGLLVTGGAGAGKSASIIEPAIFQWAMKGCSMTIYDFKGNPATLGLMAYNCWLHLQKNPQKFNELNAERKQKGLSELKIPTYEIISFDDLKKTSRPNPISPNTVLDSIDMKSQTQTFMKGLNKDFIKKQDFWALAAFALAHGIGERLRKSYPDYCTLPHLIVMGATMDMNALVDWLCEDYEVSAIMASYRSALTSKADQQIAGMLSSFQQPLTHLLHPDIFWVLGAEPKDQCDLNVNHPDNPRILSISNNGKKAAALSPLISCLLANIKTNINQQGMHPHAFIVDEYPTIYLDITDLPATARSNFVATLVSFQDKSQTESEYGKDISNKLISNLGTQFYGMTNLPENARPVADMMGTYKKAEDSVSTSVQGDPSTSTRLTNEKTLQIPEVMSQPTGHFSGKVADGQPAFFHHQFQYFDYKKIMDWKDEVDILNYPKTLQAVHKVNPELAEKLFNGLKKLNYERIKAECPMILAGKIEPIKQE